MKFLMYDCSSIVKLLMCGLVSEQGKPMVCGPKDHLFRETSKEIGSLFGIKMNSL